MKARPDGSGMASSFCGFCSLSSFCGSHLSPMLLAIRTDSGTIRNDEN